MAKKPKNSAADPVASNNEPAGSEGEATTSVTPPVNIHPPEIRLVPVDQLKSHPSNLEIYGEIFGEDDPDKELIKSVKADGVQQPLLVTPKYVVLSGERRRKTCKMAGLSEVPVIEVNPADESAEIETMLTANIQRVKTNGQVAREAAALMKVEREKARRRQAASAGGKALPANSPELQESKGDARKIVAAKLGIGEKMVDQADAIVEKLDQLKDDGDKDHEEELRQCLDRSFNSADQKVKELAGKKRTPDLNKGSASGPIDFLAHLKSLTGFLRVQSLETMEVTSLDQLTDELSALIAVCNELMEKAATKKGGAK